MFIIEKPYVSEYLVDTIINHDWAVLDNETIEECGMEEGAFRLWSSEKAANNYLQQEFPLIYSNSENGISWVLENLPKSNLASYIKLFKDKILFRETLKEMFPEFYFKSFEYLDINYVNKEEFAYPLVIKPSVGFLSFGVHVVNDVSEWDDVVKQLHKEISSNKALYKEDVVNSTKILIEELIKGEEFAIDAYYDRNGIPVILNIFHHLFKDEKDVSDRLYVTSASIMVQYMAKFAMFLHEIGEKLNIKNFPLHLEVKVTPKGEIIPIEANPMRFAGWCTADIAKYAWGINVYECFNAQIHPDWNSILEKAGKETYYFSMIEIPRNYPRSGIRDFRFNEYLANFSKVLELRHVNFKSNALFGIVFGSTTEDDELKRILSLNTEKFIV